jgi:peroxiredoxin
MADYPDHALAAGTQAPDFQLKATPDQFVGLEDFRGKGLIMTFYPADWSPVCTDQMALYNEVLPLFHEYGAYEHKDGVAKRALFVLDGEGVIRWSYVSPIGVNPGAEGILAALEQMKEQRLGAAV